MSIESVNFRQRWSNTNYVTAVVTASVGHDCPSGNKNDTAVFGRRIDE